MASPPTPATFPPEYFEEDRGPLTRRTAVAFLVLEVVIVASRFLSRRLVSAKLGLDDLLVIPSLIISLRVCIVAIVETYIAGIGRHLSVLAVSNPTAIVNWSKCGIAIEQLYCVAVVIPKLSILASYLRIFMSRSYRYVTYLLGAIIIANGIVGVVTSLASCRPLSARWQSIENLHLYCIDIVAYWRWISLPNIITDVFMLILPLPVIWHLKMSRKDRLGLTFIFLTGSVGLVTSIMRFTIFFNVSALLNDGTFISAELAVWSLVEPGIYLIASCLPTLRPLVLKLLKELQALKQISNGSSYDNGISLEWHQQYVNAADDRRSDEDTILGT